MELYTVKVKMTLVLAMPDGEEPTDKDIAKALKARSTVTASKLGKEGG